MRATTPLSSVTFKAAPVVFMGVLGFSALVASGCSGETPKSSDGGATSPSTTSNTSVTSADPLTTEVSTTAAAASKDEVKIMKEYWEGTKNLKFWNEMRRDANGRWDRNGIGRAYYAGGKLEREGLYRNGKRVGVWTYYDVNGTVLRTENRGEGSMPDNNGREQ